MHALCAPPKRGAQAQGGTYLTLLNTISNMGVILPKLAIFASIDWLSTRSCVGAATDVAASVCVTKHHQVCFQAHLEHTGWRHVRTHFPSASLSI